MPRILNGRRSVPNAREVLCVTGLSDRIVSIVKDVPVLDGIRCIGEVTDLHRNSTALYFALTDGNASRRSV